MTDKYFDLLKQRLEKVTPKLPEELLLAEVKKIHGMSDIFLTAAEKFGSPLYVLDKTAIKDRYNRFFSAFSGYFDNFQPFYAMKSNNHPFMISTLTAMGCGTDVSSGRELLTALDAGAEKIVFSGPAKTFPELELAVCHSEKVTVLIDSFSELKKLSEACLKQNRNIKAGVRITTHSNPLWRKFGIPASELNQFMDETLKYSHIEFCGLQFHSSWNLKPDNHTALLKKIGETLSFLPESHKSKLEFIDIGGGYWVGEGEWMLSDCAPENLIKKQLDSFAPEPLDHRFEPACQIEDYARAIALAYNRHIKPFCSCAVYAEPGRFISHGAMHLLLKVEDIKQPDLYITDGATNMIGWERFENDYFPVINLSSISLSERPANILGSLCTPHDVWGFACFCETISEGDILVIPSQGAYTYSLRQSFIKDIPVCVAYDSTDGSVISL